MIAANVAAAKAHWRRRNRPLIYRAHEPPSREKLVALKEYLQTFDIDFALGQVIKPETFNAILEQGRRRRNSPANHGSRAAEPDPGLLWPDQCWPFRAVIGQLRAFYVADQALCRPDRPPRPCQRLWSGNAQVSQVKDIEHMTGLTETAVTQSWPPQQKPSAAPNAARWKRNARRRTVISPPICRRMSAKSCAGAHYGRPEFRIFRYS
jgi:ribonuclease R